MGDKPSWLSSIHSWSPWLNYLFRNPLKQLKKKKGFESQELRANPSSAVLVTFFQTFPHPCLGAVYLIWGCWGKGAKQVTRKKSHSTRTLDSKTPASMRWHFPLSSTFYDKDSLWGSLPKWQGIRKWSFGFHGFQGTIDVMAGYYLRNVLETSLKWS